MTKMAAPLGLGREVYKVTGSVRFLGIHDVGYSFAKPGYLSLNKMGNDIFYLVMVTNVPKKVKKVKLHRNRFKICNREQRLTVVVEPDGITVSVNGATPAELQKFIAFLEEIKCNGMVGQLSSPRSGREDIENRPVNSKQKSPTLMSPSSVKKASGPRSTSRGGLAEVLAKPSTPPTYARQVPYSSTAKKQKKKSPLHDRTLDTNTYCNSEGKHSTSSFYGTNYSTWSPEQRVVKSSGKKEPVFLANHNVSFRSRTKPLFKEEVALTGFSNLGNTCYMNSILQSLLGLTSFSLDINNKESLKKVSPTSLYKHLHSLLACKLAGGHSSELKPHLKKVKTAISEAATRFSGHMQHDAQEFLCQVLDQLKADVAADNLSPKSAKPAGHRTQEEQDFPCPVTRNFECRVIHKISCKQCNGSVSKEEVLYDLSLQTSWSSSDGSTSIDKLIKAYFEDEEIEFSCEKCNSNSKAIVTHRFSKLPRVLILHLQRSDYNRSTEQQAKNRGRIQIPKHISIDNLCAPQVKPPILFDMNHGKKLNTPGKKLQRNNKIKETENGRNQNVLTPPARRQLHHDFSRSLAKNRNCPENYTLTMSDYSADDSGPDHDSMAEESHKESKLLSLSEEQQLKRALELSAEEAKASQILNSQDSADPKTASTVMFAARNQSRSGDNEEFELFGGSGATSDQEISSDYDCKMNYAEMASEDAQSPEKFLLPQKACSDIAKRQQKCTKEDVVHVESGTDSDACVVELNDSSSDGSAIFISNRNKDCARVVAKACDEKLSCKGQGAFKRRIDQTKHNSSGYCSNSDSPDSDFSYNLKRRKIVHTYSRKKPKGSSLCSLMDKKPTLTKFDGNMPNLTPTKGKVQFSPANKSNDLEANSTKYDFQTPDFSEDDIAKALSLSLQDQQQEDDQLNQVIEMSMQEYENGCSVDQGYLSTLPIEDMEVHSFEDSGFQNDVTEEQHSYRLVSIVSHIGSSSSSGHYISDVYDCKAKQWTSYDDSTALKVDEHLVRFGRAGTVYIAFYLHKQCVDAIDTASELKSSSRKTR